MRSYSVAAVAFAVACEAKWIDNLLSHRPVPGALGGTRGLPRRIDPDGAVIIAITRVLAVNGGFTIDKALALAIASVEAQGKPVRLATSVTLLVDTDAIRTAVELRLVEAMEVVLQPKRGRRRVSGAQEER